MQTKSPDLNCPNCHLALTTLAKSLQAAGLTPAALNLPVCSGGTGACYCQPAPRE
jgi:hypothetical protein